MNNTTNDTRHITLANKKVCEDRVAQFFAPFGIEARIAPTSALLGDGGNTDEDRRASAAVAGKHDIIVPRWAAVAWDEGIRQGAGDVANRLRLMESAAAVESAAKGAGR